MAHGWSGCGGSSGASRRQQAASSTQQERRPPTASRSLLLASAPGSSTPMALTDRRLRRLLRCSCEHCEPRLGRLRGGCRWRLAAAAAAAAAAAVGAPQPGRKHARAGLLFDVPCALLHDATASVDRERATAQLAIVCVRPAGRWRAACCWIGGRRSPKAILSSDDAPQSTGGVPAAARPPLPGHLAACCRQLFCFAAPVM